VCTVALEQGGAQMPRSRCPHPWALRPLEDHVWFEDRWMVAS
jgi:hypothetical protein